MGTLASYCGYPQITATGWALLAAACLMWPGLGSSNPDAALPGGFEGDRLAFELLVLGPIVALVAAAGLLYRFGPSQVEGRRTEC